VQRAYGKLTSYLTEYYVFATGANAQRKLRKNFRRSPTSRSGASMAGK
jgi:hypothetical protein